MPCASVRGFGGGFVRVDDRFVYCLLHQWVRLCSNLPAILLVFPRSIGSLVQAGYSQQKQQKNQPAPGIQVWQDKRRFPNAPHDASQPAPLSQESGTRVLNPKKTTAFERHFKTVLCTALWAVLCPMLSTVSSSFSLNDLRLLSRPDFLLLSSRSNAGGIRRRRYWHSGRH
jgi:hypothetical protein